MLSDYDTVDFARLRDIGGLSAFMYFFTVSLCMPSSRAIPRSRRNRLGPRALSLQTDGTVSGADHNTHVLELLPRSAGFAAELTLHEQAIANSSLLDVLPVQECFFSGVVRAPRVLLTLRDLTEKTIADRSESSGTS